MLSHKDESWLKWYEDFLVNANNSDDKEKNGTLVLLATNLQDTIAKINLTGIGLKRFTPFLAAQSDTMSYFEVELYVETMTVEFPK